MTRTTIHAAFVLACLMAGFSLTLEWAVGK
jgi:hypothetical protein